MIQKWDRSIARPTVDTVDEAYAKTYDNHEVLVSVGVQETFWTGWLLDKHYDEFAFRATLTDGLQPGTVLYSLIVQECEDGKAPGYWIEISAPGKGANDYKYPAPGVKFLPAKAAH